MKSIFAAVLVAATISASTPPTPIAAPLTYRFDEVRRTVKLSSAGAKEVAASRGVQAHSGDKIRTGFFSYALIASEQHRAKFEIYSSTDVQLATGTPGVILSIERGRLHAIFDKITGNEPRVVATPGALLAVRGTEYTVEVENDGRTTLGVFEGAVEISSPLRAEPLLVPAGQAATFSRREPPAPRPMPRNMTRPNRDPQKKDDEGRRAPDDRTKNPNDPGDDRRNPPPSDRGGNRPAPPNPGPGAGPQRPGNPAPPPRP